MEWVEFSVQLTLDSAGPFTEVGTVFQFRSGAWGVRNMTQDWPEAWVSAVCESHGAVGTMYRRLLQAVNPEMFL